MTQYMFDLMLASDLIIALSYFCIPIELVYRDSKGLHQRDPRYRNILAICVAFILLCGITHLVTFIGGTLVCAVFFKFITACVSTITAIYLVRLIPKFLILPVQVADLSRQISEQHVATICLKTQKEEAGRFRRITERVRSQLTRGCILKTSVSEIALEFGCMRVNMLQPVVMSPGGANLKSELSDNSYGPNHGSNSSSCNGSMNGNYSRGYKTRREFNDNQTLLGHQELSYLKRRLSTKLNGELSFDSEISNNRVYHAISDEDISQPKLDTETEGDQDIHHSLGNSDDEDMLKSRLSSETHYYYVSAAEHISEPESVSFEQVQAPIPGLH